LIPDCVINCRPVGVLRMRDEEGGDEKLIAVPSRKVTSRYEAVTSYRDLPEILVRQIAHFFERYKDLEDGKWVRIERWGEDHEAREMINQAIARAKHK
jgi:inorganic pyrophosphatase